LRIALFVISILLVCFPGFLAAAESTRQPFSVSWSSAGSRIEGDFWDLFFSTPRNGILVGQNGSIARTSDGGENWRNVDSGVQADLWSAHFPNPSTGWIVGEGGTILVTHDAGATWLPQRSGIAGSLVSVHFTDTDTGWAVASDGRIISTSNGGETWTVVWSEQGGAFAAITFANGKTGWVVGRGGIILRTRDGGGTWNRQESSTSQNLWSVHFKDTNEGWAVGDSGTVLVTHDGGIQWQAQASGSERDLSRVYFVNTTTGWIVGDGGTILTTRNGGEHWRSQAAETKRLLIGIQFADQNSGWIVGFRGTLLKSSLTALGPELARASTQPSGILGEVTFTCSLREAASNPVRNMYLWARVGRGPWHSLGEATLTAPLQWARSWKPSELGFHAGDEIEYRIQPDDGGPPAFFTTGRFLFEPWWVVFWRDNKHVLTGILLATSALLLLLLGIGLLLVFAPATLAHIGALPLGKENPDFKLNFVSLLTLGNRLLQELILPFLCRHPRVKRAWIERYLDGRAKFENLNSPARRAFFNDADILDAWVTCVSGQIESGLKQIELLQQRRTYVEFPLNDTSGECAIERPSPETFRPIFARSRTVISIIGVGGAGKSTLACALGRWGFDPDPLYRLAAHRMVPIFVAEDTTSLFESVSANLHRMLDGDDLSPELVRGLLAHKRLLVVVDALSERNAETQRHVEQFHKAAEPIGALIVTSRIAPDFGPIDRTALYPVRLDARRIVPFIIGYLDRRESEGLLRDGRMQLQLGEKILALSEMGGQRAPITALLVTLFVDSARRRVQEGHALDDLPKVMPDIFVDYLKRLNTVTGSSEQKIADPIFIQAGQVVAAVSLGRSLVPQDFLAAEALAALSKDGLGSQGQQLLDQLIGAGVIERRAPGGYVLLRFSLDPAAEYLAATRQIIMLKSADARRWKTYLSSLRKIDGYPDVIEGYLTALTNCYRALKQELSLIDLAFPWEDSNDSAPTTQRLRHDTTSQHHSPY